MSGYRFLIYLVLLTGAATIGAAAQTVVLPPVSLASSESAEIDFKSIAAEYPGWRSTGTCQGSLTFYGPDDSVVGNSPAFSIPPSGQISAVPFPQPQTTRFPTIISAKLTLTPAPATYDGPTPPVPDCAVVYSLVTYDVSTGVAHTWLVGEAAQGTQNVGISGSASPLPCISPGDDCNQLFAHELAPVQVTVMPPSTIAATETLEVDVLSAGNGYSGLQSGNCSGSISFSNSNGAAIGSPIGFTLGGSSQLFSASLPYAAIAAATAREAVSSQIALTPVGVTQQVPASAVPLCAAVFSVKTLDTATGVTHALIGGSTYPAATATVLETSQPRNPNRNGAGGPARQR